MRVRQRLVLFGVERHDRPTVGTNSSTAFLDAARTGEYSGASREESSLDLEASNEIKYDEDGPELQTGGVVERSVSGKVRDRLDCGKHLPSTFCAGQGGIPPLVAFLSCRA